MLALMIFGIGIVNPVAAAIDATPMLALFYLFIVTVLSAGMYLLTLVVMHVLGAKGAMTAGILSGFRNVGLSYALIGSMMGPHLGLYVGVSMLPIFIAPAVIRVMILVNAEIDPEPSRA